MIGLNTKVEIRIFEEVRALPAQEKAAIIVELLGDPQISRLYANPPERLHLFAEMADCLANVDRHAGILVWLSKLVEYRRLMHELEAQKKKHLPKASEDSLLLTDVQMLSAEMQAIFIIDWLFDEDTRGILHTFVELVAEKEEKELSA